MTRFRSIGWRVLVVAAVAGLVGAASALWVTVTVARETLVSQLAPLAVAHFRAEDARACEAAPEAWSLAFPTLGERAYAYDAATGLSRNASAPPLSKSLLDRLEPTTSASAIELFGMRRGGVILFRTSARSPCELVQVVWHRPVFPKGSSIVIASGGVSALLASVLGVVTLLLPLARRIRRLRTAAERVGHADTYEALGDRADGDELDVLGAILDKTHARLRADASMLVSQRNTLELHLADVAHDLRTPLTSLQVAIEYAADEAEVPELREVLTGALSDAVYLSALTNNLRMASRLRTGWDPRDEVTEVDLGELVTRIAARAARLARRRAVELDVSVPDDPVRVVCNVVAAEQAFGNIVDNAAAYVDANGHVAVVLAADDHGFSVAVRDDGPGVPPQELPRLGERTFRADEARRRDPRGDGLGLAITAEVCSRFGWELRFAAAPPRGLLVTVRGQCR